MRTSMLMENAEALTLDNLNTEYGIFGPGKEVFPWVLYDKQAYPQAGFTAPLSFFQRQQGMAGVSNEATNMPGQGQFPSNVQFVADSLEYVFIPGKAAGRTATETDVADNWADTAAVLSRGYVTITLASVKNYGKISPLNQLVPSYRVSAGGAALAGFNGFQAVAADRAASLAQIDWPTSVGQPYPIGPFFIPSTTAFEVALSFPDGAVAVSNADCEQMFNLNGLYIQQRQ